MPKAQGTTKPVQIRLEDRQIKALREAAFMRAMQAGSLKPDMSGIVREALDEWFAKHPFKRPTPPR